MDVQKGLYSKIRSGNKVVGVVGTIPRKYGPGGYNL